MDCSFLEKPALTMNIDDFANGLNFAKIRSKSIFKALYMTGIRGDITPQIVQKFKAETFNKTGTLTIIGLVEIFEDLKRAGLPNHTSVKKYMTNCIMIKS